MAKGIEDLNDITAFMKSQFGIEMPRQLISSYKTQQRAREAKKGEKATGKPGRKPKAVEGYLAPPPAKAVSEEAGLLEALEAIKPLVASLGVERVKRLAELLG